MSNINCKAWLKKKKLKNVVHDSTEVFIRLVKKKRTDHIYF